MCRQENGFKIILNGTAAPHPCPLPKGEGANSRKQNRTLKDAVWGWVKEYETADSPLRQSFALPPLLRLRRGKNSHIMPFAFLW